MGRANSNSALSGYAQVYLVYEDLRLTYQQLYEKTELLGEIKPYLDCEVKCSCGVYYHHLSFKMKTTLWLSGLIATCSTPLLSSEIFLFNSKFLVSHNKITPSILDPDTNKLPS